MRGSDDMAQWLRLLGYSDEHLHRLRVIHIAGTNGKGTTSAFVESFLRAHGQTTGFPRKTGLYTSPHIRTVRERIRINNEPISEDLFARRFFEVWNKLPQYASEALDVPRYLQLLCLLSLHVFIKEDVDVAIYETHMGGEFDATNVVRSPVVTGITAIGMDHVQVLDRNLQHRFSLEDQRRYVELWQSIDVVAQVSSERTIEEALSRAKDIGDREGGMQTLVTGSQHLVSGAVCLLEDGLS
ncbi:MAG: hypothetical protein M1817_003952 [Caeruleum heppii]|nr:MAG: hypothetical protein M1817_003952 [Caeruleum heppii]